MTITPLFKRCKACGQVMRHKPSADPVGDAILEALSQTGGFVKMGILKDMVGMDVHRQTVWDRCQALEKQKRIYRDLAHPKKGWHYNYRWQPKAEEKPVESDGLSIAA